MSSLIRFITDRLRRLAGNDDHRVERRQAPRLKEQRNLRLLFSLTLLDVKINTDDADASLTLLGHTRDISITGLALVVPSLRVGGHDLTKGDRTFLVELELPSGPIRLQAVPVRVEYPSEQEQDSRYVIGVRIMQISESAHDSLTRYLRETRR